MLEAGVELWEPGNQIALAAETTSDLRTIPRCWQQCCHLGVDLSESLGIQGLAETRFSQKVSKNFLTEKVTGIF